ncbi:MAG: hypothetical protein AB7D06_08750 [Pedobacter sp.]
MARSKFIGDMHKAEAKVRAALAGEVRTLTREEIDEIAPTLQPPIVEKRCLEYGYVDE